MSNTTGLLRHLATTFLDLHTVQEERCWSDRMGLTDDPTASARAYADAQHAFNAFASDPRFIPEIDAAIAHVETVDEASSLAAWKRFFQNHVIVDPEVRAMAAEIVTLETMLRERITQFRSGYTDPKTLAFMPLDPQQLLINTQQHPDERVRKACYEGQLQVERFVLENGYLELVALRNRMAERRGYADFYDLRANETEGMSKADLFGLIDPLVQPFVARAALVTEQAVATIGPSVVEPWNQTYYTRGGAMARADVYFSAKRALPNWIRTFAALGIGYRGATLTLDLVRRPGKFSNGFMQAPGITVDANGARTSARINATAFANIGKTGSGMSLQRTLLHECGHAAHFACMEGHIPAQVSEYFPMPSSLMETQSKFCDGMMDLPAWRARYTMDGDGRPMPVETILDLLRAEHGSRALVGVNGLATILGERSVYEMAPSALTADRLLKETRWLETNLIGCGSSRPLFSVPHLVDGPSACAYHGYLLANMGVAALRDHFLQRDGFLVDNPKIGQDLRLSIWRLGARTTLPAAIQQLTGRPFSPDAYVRQSLADTDRVCAAAKDEIKRARQVPIPVSIDHADLEAHVRLMHGNELIADNTNGFGEMCAAFTRWINDHQNV